jgi:hypothetical protein
MEAGDCSNNTSNKVMTPEVATIIRSEDQDLGFPRNILVGGGRSKYDTSNKVTTPEVAAIVGSQCIGAWLSPDDRLVSIPGSNLTRCAICHRSGQRGDHAVPQESPASLGTAFAQPTPLGGCHPRYMTPSHTFTVQGWPPHLIQMSPS